MDGNQQPIIVSFSGIDGAGKSTQIRNLRQRLSDTGLRVRVLAFWDDVAVLGQARGIFSHAVFKSEQGIGSPEAPVCRRDKNVRSWYMTPVRFFFYLLDALSLRSATRRLRTVPTDVIIFDRYLYDELANLRLEHRVGSMYARWLMRLVPHPDVAYLLDADPAQARERKPEYPLEFLHINREAYLALSAGAGMTVLAPRSEEETARIVTEGVLAQCQIASEDTSRR
jgi:thymidylate kinase